MESSYDSLLPEPQDPPRKRSRRARGCRGARLSRVLTEHTESEGDTPLAATPDQVLEAAITEPCKQQEQQKGKACGGAQSLCQHLCRADLDERGCLPKPSTCVEACAARIFGPLVCHALTASQREGYASSLEWTPCRCDCQVANLLLTAGMSRHTGAHMIDASEHAEYPISVGEMTAGCACRDCEVHWELFMRRSPPLGDVWLYHRWLWGIR